MTPHLNRSDKGSVGHRKSEVLGSILGLATCFRFSFRFFKKGSCQLLAESMCTKYWLTKSVVRLTDHPDMTLDVYRGRKTITQQQIRRHNIGFYASSSSSSSDF